MRSRKNLRRGRRAGQSTTEYVILAGLVVAALAVIMSTFPDHITGYCLRVIITLSLPII